MIRMYSDLACYNMMIGRETNFRWRDLSGVLSNPCRLGIVAEESAELFWEIPEGPVVNMSLDFLTRPSRRTMIAFGQQGTLEWDGILGTTTLRPANGAPDVQTTSETIDQILAVQDGVFVDSGSRTDPRSATVEDALKALALCDAARRASQNRCLERVLYP